MSPRFVAALAVAAAPVLAFSCRGVVVGDAYDAAAALCAQLERCYPNEFTCDDIQGTLKSADAEVQSQFLSQFDLEACTQSCAAALACLNTAPYCGSDACTKDVECCAWSEGLSACDDEGGTCCAAAGAPCETRKDCCDGQTCTAGFCGGSECTKVGEGCEVAADCCTDRCVIGTCRKKDCSLIDEPCQTVADCCDGKQQALPEGAVVSCDAGGKCTFTTPQCLVAGDPCTDDGSCCDDLRCMIDPLGPTDAVPRCLDDTCAYPGETCGNKACCFSELGYLCDEMSTCSIEICSANYDPCLTGDECCSGACDGELQSGSFTCCETGCSSPCVPSMTGIDPSCPMDPGVSICIRQTRALDPFCDCIWDEICADRFIGLCSFACMNQ